MRRLLKPLRLLLALPVLAGFVAAFVDFRGLIPAAVAHYLAALQLTPALLVLLAGGGAGLVLAGWLVVTLLVGRVYCSVICPLGLLQDACARLFRGWRRRRLLPFAPAQRGWRLGFLAGVVVLAGLAGRNLAVAWSDPYSHFGRIATGLVRPLVVAGNNLLVGWVPDMGGLLFRVPPTWPGPGLLVPAAVALMVLAGLSAWRGRLYCNTFCPVGTVLGLFSRHAAFRLELDKQTCTKCARCLRECKAQCLDLRSGMIDASRCVACFNCIAACPEHGIRHRFAWRRQAHIDPPVPPAAPDPERRAWLGGALLLAPAAVLLPKDTAAPAEAPRPPVMPPGVGDRGRFLSRCTACQLCVSSCPTQVLQPAFLEYGPVGLARPRLDYGRAFCNFDCRRCGEVCPTGAIAPLPLAEKHLTSIGTARFDQQLCIVDRDGTDCAACSEHCPTKAVDTVPFRDNLRLPQVREELCIGCGACEYACPARPRKAILVTARDRHTRARPAESAPAVRRPAPADFPF